MEDDRFKIFVHRLKEGKAEHIAETFSPQFMGIDEEDLVFADPVHVEGTACVSGEMFVLSLRLKTVAQLPCVVCNAPTPVPLEVADLMHTQSMDELKSGSFKMGGLIREALLLEVPLAAECCHNNCPERINMTQYFKGE